MVLEAEHERRMESKLDDGQSHAPETDNGKKLNKYLGPREKLSEEEKRRIAIWCAGIFVILAGMGM
jgi:hypothetical protein